MTETPYDYAQIILAYCKDVNTNTLTARKYRFIDLPSGKLRWGLRWLDKNGYIKSSDRGRSWEVIKMLEEQARHLHYLEVLHNNSSVMQPEIRDAIKYAFETLMECE